MLTMLGPSLCLSILIMCALIKHLLKWVLDERLVTFDMAHYKQNNSPSTNVFSIFTIMITS